MPTDTDALGSDGPELDTGASSERGQAGVTSARHSGWLRRSAVAAGVLTVFSMGLVLFNGNRVSNGSGPLAVVDASLDQKPAYLRGPTAVVERAEPSFEKVTVKRFNELETRVDALSRYLDVQIDRLSAQGVSQGDQLSLQDQRLAAAEENWSVVEARVAEIVDQASTEAEAVNTLRGEVRRLQFARKKAETAHKPKSREQSLPFSVDAVDLWEGIPHVMVSKGNSRGFFREGDRVPEMLGSGWWVARIDHAKGEVVFADPDGHIHTAEVGR